MPVNRDARRIESGVRSCPVLWRTSLRVGVSEFKPRLGGVLGKHIHGVEGQNDEGRDFHRELPGR